jgi:tetratricopeptide (TPR) repeat protein
LERSKNIDAMNIYQNKKSSRADDGLKSSRASISYQTAEKLLGLRHYQQALISYNAAIDLKSDFPAAYCGRGATHMALGNFQLAVADANRAIVLNPNYAIAYYLRGTANYTIGNLEIAKNNLNMAADLFQEQNNQDEYKRIVRLLKQMENNTAN